MRLEASKYHCETPNVIRSFDVLVVRVLIYLEALKFSLLDFLCILKLRRSRGETSNAFRSLGVLAVRVLMH